ncbi:MAG: bifunctional hydroxymethylpyrimidine kinase/phosphomethylpyrimidine kinase [Solirubrobacteraceae bacterium]
MPGTTRTPRVLTIAGSDSGGGAGIQADLKAFASCGVHGMSAITAITVQNTLGVEAVHAIPPEMVRAQVRAVLVDIGVDAVKVGMLGSAPTIRAVSAALDELPAGTPVVVDPVMVSESGARLLDPDAEGAMQAEILPRATILTPNLPEARALVGSSCARDVSDPEQHEASVLARAVLALGPKIVVLTGGHREQATDLFLDSDSPERIVSIPGMRHADGAAHGSGCTHSSILAAQLALGRAPLQAAFAARALTGEAVARGLRDIGQGPGPVDAIGLARVRAEPGLS